MATQIAFSLRQHPSVKTVALVGTWDNYAKQQPLKGDGKGNFAGKFKLTVNAGGRYWYYYIVNGYHLTHDPSQTSTVEATTQRSLNILDIPGSVSSAKTSSKPKVSVDIPKGRPLSQSEIKHPKPYKPNETRHLRTADYQAPPTVAEIASRFSRTTLDSDSDSDSSLPSSPGGLSRSSDSPVSDDSGWSTPQTPKCSCQRYGITRSGQRVKIDCGGQRCGYSDDSSDSCSDSSEEEPVVTKVKHTTAAPASRRRVHSRR